ncbi:MAG TPA: hypothetical protein DCE41_37985 [Cytophagales bacterium]|nr:hypothetical protein [Cytophagales bacterium]HAA20695.1 hypothetical protein [Cytophagales bacterium]HAP65149.1 hypothetical protein [Cytophagales bacterium]
MKGILEEIHRRHYILSISGWVFVLLGLAFAVGILVDDRELLGINLWIKPLKFALSIAIFLWTMGWVIYEAKMKHHPRYVLGWLFIVFMVIEIALIALQSYRGETSHFNNSTLFNARLYTIMGFAIGFNTLTIAFLAMVFFSKKFVLPMPYLWAIRLGLIVLVLGSLEGVLIVRNYAHTVGAPDGGPGLPFLNWSTTHGDLRIAHFLGIHALQAFMIVGVWLGHTKLPKRRATVVLVLFALAYTAVVAATFYQAMNEQPLLG